MTEAELRDQENWFDFGLTDHIETGNFQHWASRTPPVHLPYTSRTPPSTAPGKMHDGNVITRMVRVAPTALVNGGRAPCWLIDGGGLRQIRRKDENET